MHCKFSYFYIKLISVSNAYLVLNDVCFHDTFSIKREPSTPSSHAHI